TLIALGGNRDLKPERATTLSATFDLHPRDSRFDLAATYYSVAYRDRIVAPIQYLGSALSEPAYAVQVTRNPTPDQVAATIASGPTFLNYSGAAFDPAAVVAIVDGSNVNAGRVNARGLDVMARYGIPVGRHEMIFGADVGYLDSTRRVSVSSPLEILAGTIFNPPHWRGRGTASWRAGALTLTGDLNYTGGVRDVRAAQKFAIGGMTTTGLTARWVVNNGPRWLDGFDLSVSAQNLLDAKPHTILRTTTGDTPYDSTNYSAIGRFLSIAVRKAW
ncbi:MAG TPA: TonB-dependent receptor, partial [Sphingomonas sp.]|uniref:TonB-dependent receptor domain-containing protein n=1 Tax=Sphingomonas sp. TaxID=28214 RepID=UPI002BCC2F3B